MPRKAYHAVPDGYGGWGVKKDGGKRSIKNFENKSDAVDYAHQIRKKPGKRVGYPIRRMDQFKVPTAMEAIPTRLKEKR
ncbi:MULTISPECIES: DUF2188 domain-containing protein [unclassified Microbulbifer]|uniref:DUF2188 domain-containing protein n=1 Tax=unclassified Microbulbifer TaxID=2619833 RepID=UPI0027E51D06|nr:MULTISPECIES: DUF2188 domain-containing protein [unclassified Microbulbifer]